MNTIPEDRLAQPALITATVAVSFSAIFIRVAAADAFTIVWLRMSLATVMLLPFARIRRPRWSSWKRDDLLAITVGGILLAGHFLLWTASLNYTSIATSVLLVSLHPLVVAPVSAVMHRDRFLRRDAAALILGLMGTCVTCMGDVQLSGRALFGDLLALGGAACLAAYLLNGRRLRASLPVVPYSAHLYAVVAVVAALVAAGSGKAHLPSVRSLLACLALAAVCTVGGHTVYNWALRHVAALTVSLAFLGEAPLTAVWALLIFSAVPPPSTVAGGALILGGLFLAVTRRSPGLGARPIAVE